MKLLYTVVLISGLLLVASGCETIKGMGKDISTVGGWLTKGSSNVQNPEK